MTKIRFLEIEEICAIHKNQIERFGGSFGIRDYGLLDSAINNPKAAFAGNYLHQDYLKWLQPMRMV